MIQHRILVIPGLGDIHATDWIINRWKTEDRHVSLFDPQWETSEAYEDKFNRLLSFYDESEFETKLVAISAGGSLAVRLLKERPVVVSAAFVSCKVKGSSSIGPKFQKRAPALMEAVKHSESVLSQGISFDGKCTIYRPLFDNIVPINDMLVGECRRRRIPIVGHAAGIGAALLFYLP